MSDRVCPHCQSTDGTHAVVCDTKSRGRRRPDVLAGCWCDSCGAMWYDWDYHTGESVFEEWHADSPVKTHHDGGA